MAARKNENGDTPDAGDANATPEPQAAAAVPDALNMICVGDPRHTLTVTPDELRAANARTGGVVCPECGGRMQQKPAPAV